MSPAAFIDDPRWYAFLPETREGGKKRHLPTHEDCARLDVESAAAHLRAGGTLGAMAGYEERPGQIAMLEAIARAFNGREHLMIEAGTGVGKSLAYLVPSILWAYTNDTPVVISTATRNLQSQLMQSDIPRALRILGDAAANFKVALLKGRGNYLCLRALGEFFAPGYWTMSEADQAEMPHLIEWLRTTPDGDLDSYEGLPRTLLWQMFYSDKVATAIDHVSDGSADGISIAYDRASDALTVSADRAATVAVYAADGTAVVRTAVAAGQSKVSMAGAAHGVYVVRVASAAGAKTVKLTK